MHVDCDKLKNASVVAQSCAAFCQEPLVAENRFLQLAKASAHAAKACKLLVLEPASKGDED